LFPANWWIFTPPPPNKSRADALQVCKGWKRIIDDQEFWKQLLQYRWGVKLKDNSIPQPSKQKQIYHDGGVTTKKRKRKGGKDKKKEDTVSSSIEKYVLQRLALEKHHDDLLSPTMLARVEKKAWETRKLHQDIRIISFHAYRIESLATEDFDGTVNNLSLPPPQHATHTLSM